MGYPNQLGGTPGLTRCRCRPKSLARSWVLAQFRCKCWFRPSSSSATHRAGWLLAGRLVEGTTCLTVTPQALQGWGLLAMGCRQGCGQRLHWADLGLPGKEEANVLPVPASCCCRFLGGNEGFYLPFSSPLAAWITGIVWSAGQCWCCGLLPAIPNVLPSGCSRGESRGCTADAPGAAGGQMVTAFAAFSSR